jgi:hypothetical protein
VRHQNLEIATALLSLLTGVMASAQKSLLDTLRDAHATEPDAAIVVETRNPVKAWQLRRFLKFGALQEAPDGIYLDESVWQLYRKHRRKRALVALAAVLVLWAWAWWAGR